MARVAPIEVEALVGLYLAQRSVWAELPAAVFALQFGRGVVICHLRKRASFFPVSWEPMFHGITRPRESL